MDDLTLKNKIFIGLFNQGQYMMSTIIASSLLIFYTDYIGLNSIKVFGYAIFIFGFWNAINDPLFGYYSDKLISRGGLRKPLMKRGMPLMLFGFIMVIFVPPGWSDWNIFILLLIGLIIFDFGKALSMVNYGAYQITIADSPQKRSNLNMVCSYVSFIPGALIGIVPTVFLTGDYTYEQVLGVFIGIILTFFILSYLSLPYMPESRKIYERKSKIQCEDEEIIKVNESLNLVPEYPPSSVGVEISANMKPADISESDNLSLKNAFRETIKSKPFRYVVLYRFFACFFQGIYYQNLIYMMNWVIEAEGIWPLLISGAGGLTINALYPFLTKFRKKNGTVSTIQRCFLISIPGYIIMFLSTNVWSLLIGYTLTTVALSALFLFDPVLLGDVSDDDFINTGTHKQGIFVSIHGFFTTLAYSSAIFILTFMLDLFEYNGKAAFQTENTISGIRFTVSFLPMIAVIICLVILKFYPLQKEKFIELRLKLAEVYGESVLENENVIEEFRRREKIKCDNEGIIFPKMDVKSPNETGNRKPE